MTFKPNPGCDMPEVQLPPSLDDFFSNLQKKIATAKAAAIAANTNELLKTAAVQADKLKQVDKLKDQATQRLKDIEKYKKIITKFTDLKGNCPLCDVLDKKATGDSG